MTEVGSKISKSHSRVLFGSCNSQHHEQVIWNSILRRNASAFVWGGDAIYADSIEKVTPPHRFQKLYEKQKQNPGYKKLMDQNIPILGVLDDHDYGTDNGDVTYPYRKESGVEFACNFLELEGTAMCERAKQGLGVYGVKVMDFSRRKGKEMLSDIEAGLDPDVLAENDTEAQVSLSIKSVAIFLLDMRSNKSPYSKIKKNDYTGDFLGGSQWKWFQEALNRSTASVNIVVQGIQLHTDRVWPVETWSRFPTSQHRLYQALLQDHVRAPIVVSGDVHHAQLLRKDCRFVKRGKPSPTSQTRTLLEITTSGMTHSWGTETCGKPHKLFLCRMKIFKWAAKKSMQFAQRINGARVWTELIDNSTPDMAQHNTKEEGKLGLQFTLERNFAELEFDWEDQSVTLRVLGEKLDGTPLLSTRWSFESLSAENGGDSLGDPALSNDQQMVDSFDNLARLGAFDKELEDGQWICLNYRGLPDPIHRVVGLMLPILMGVFLTMTPCILPFLVTLLFRRTYSRRPGAASKAKHH